MANLSNINNILRTGSLGVGINRDPLGAFEISSATKPGIKMFNTAASGKTYEAYSDVNGNYIIYDQDADDNRLVINSAGNATFASTIDAGGRIKVSGGSTDQYYFEGARNSVGVTYRLYDNANNIYHDSWSAQVIRLNQNGGSGGNLIITGGNVGIGGSPNDWDPTITALQIDAVSISAFLNNVMLIGGNAYYDDTANAYKYINDGFASQLTVNNSGNFEFKTAGSGTAGGTVSLDTKVKILNNGNVGIGTTNPSTRLEVAASATTGVDIAHFSNSNGSAKIKHTLDGVGSGRVSIFDASNNEDIRLSAQSNSWFNAGNVGIGRNDPGYPLDVDGIIRSKPLTQTANVSGKLILASDLNSVTEIGGVIGTISFTSDDSDAGADFEVGKIEVVNQNPYGLRNDMTFTTRDQSTVSEKMRIDFRGNVGIGTTGPLSKLELGPNGSLGANITNENVILNLDGGYGTTGVTGQYKVMGFVGTTRSVTDITAQTSGEVLKNFYLGIIGDNYFNNNRFSIWQGGVERLTILGTATGSGNVGIGVTGPVNKIQANYAPVSIASLTASAGTSSTNWNRNAFLMGTGASVSNALAFGVSGTANDRKAWIQSGHPDSAANSLGTISLNPLGGKVGIGTTSPSEILHIKGGGSGPEIRLEGTWGSHYIRAYNDNWNFLVGGTVQAINIKNNGNVSIGTTNNGSKLNVGGTIAAATNNLSNGMIVPRSLVLSHAGNSGTFTRTFNPVTLFGMGFRGGQVLFECTGWSQRVNCGYIQFQNAGGAGVITSVTYVQTAVQGNGSISVSVNSANDNSIDINFSNWHVNSHGFMCRITTNYM